MVEVISRDKRTGVYITDYRDLIKIMRQTEPDLLREMRKDFRKISQPMVRDVKRGIDKEPPTRGIHLKRPQNSVSGFHPVVIPGRLTWGANSQNKNKKVDAVYTKSPRVKTRLMNNATMTSIARVEVHNAAVIMADMAGSSNEWVNKKSITRPYLYSGGGHHVGKYGSKRQLITMRQHRINGQGAAMIRALNAKRKASRFVYPAAEASMPQVRYAALNVLRRGFDKVNMNLRSK
jgi:hypothetical protein